MKIKIKHHPTVAGRPVWEVICHATDCGCGIAVPTQPDALYWATAHASHFHNVKL